MARILITSGGTREPIDEVRYISNVSSGATGASLASNLRQRGHQVCLLRGTGSIAVQDLESEQFSSTADLQERLQQRLGLEKFDAVIMCAAVSDYRPDTHVKGKIRSDAEALTLKLVRTPKLLPQLKSYSKTPLLVVGFKLTVHASPEQALEAVKLQFASGTVDLVIHNDLTEIHARPVHPFNLYRNSDHAPERLFGTSNLAASLGTLIDLRQTRLR